MQQIVEQHFEKMYRHKSEIMKKINPILLLIIGIILSTSCSSDSNPTPLDIRNRLQSTITQGNWAVANFSNNGNNQTQIFSGYTFNFNAQNAVLVTFLESTVPGNWTANVEGPLPVLFLQFFATNDVLQILNTSWEILHVAPSEIRLRRTNADSGTVNLLTFTKI